MNLNQEDGGVQSKWPKGYFEERTAETNSQKNDKGGRQFSTIPYKYMCSSRAVHCSTIFRPIHT